MRPAVVDAGNDPARRLSLVLEGVQGGRDMTARGEPPKKEPAPSGKGTGSQRLEVATANRTQRNPAHRYRAGDTLAAQLRRRRPAAARSVPLDCGCRDPWRHRCRPRPVLSARMVDGAAAASEHLTAVGLPPVFDPDTTAAVRRRQIPVWLRKWAA